MSALNRMRTGAAALVATAALVALAAAPASAHVTVNPSTAPAGGFAALTFRVPTESDSASTTKLEVVFPTDTPLAFVSIKPHPGWDYRVTKATLAKPVTDEGDTITEAVASVTWTADSARTAIKPGEFDEFEISAGPLPDSGSMTFKALQTYDDGTVVRWIQPPGTDGSEPDHPAPVLTLTGPGAVAPGPGAQAGTVQVSAEPVSAIANAPASTTGATVLAVLGLLVGAAGLAMGAVALRRTRVPARMVDNSAR